MESQYHWFTGISRGFVVDKLRVQLLAYRLITVFLSSKELSNLCTLDDETPSLMKQQFEQSEIEHLLLQIAILVRAADDSARSGQTFGISWNPKVGTLIQNLETDTTEDLMLREACNKIIHAEKVNYDVYRNSELSRTYIEPTFIYLYGRKENKRWKAILDIKRFCLEVCHIPE